MTEGLENTRSENNQVSPPPLPCSVALRGVSVFIREYRENAYETRGLTLTAKNLMKSFNPSPQKLLFLRYLFSILRHNVL